MEPEEGGGGAPHRLKEQVRRYFREPGTGGGGLAHKHDPTQSSVLRWVTCAPSFLAVKLNFVLNLQCVSTMSTRTRALLEGEVGRRGSPRAVAQRSQGM